MVLWASHMEACTQIYVPLEAITPLSSHRLARNGKNEKHKI